MAYRTLLTGCVAGLALAGCESNPSYHLGFPGPYDVAQYEATTEFYGHDVAFTVYYPDSASAPGARPLILFNTGWNQPRSTNAAYCIQLAQWGLVVINRQYPSFLVTTFAERHVEHNSVLIDWVLEQNANSESVLFGRIDEGKIGVTGYSLGAGIALTVPIRDPRVRACVALDALPQRPDDLGSIDYVKDLTVPVIFVRAGVAGITGEGLPLFEYAPAPAMEVTIERASHMQFEDNIVGLNILGLLLFPGADADPLVTRGLATKYMVAWFKVFLDEDPSFVEYLDGPPSAADEAAGLVRVARRLAPPEG